LEKEVIMSKKKLYAGLACLLSLALLASFLVGCGTKEEEKPPEEKPPAEKPPEEKPPEEKPPVKVTEYNYGTTSSASGYFVVGVTTSDIINEEVPGVHMTVVETGCTHDNIARMYTGEIDFGFGGGAALLCAYHGLTERYAGNPHTWLRMGWNGGYNIILLAVRADSDIQSMSDLAGKKVCPGIPGSDTADKFYTALTALGINVNWQFGGLGDAIEKVKDKNIDGVVKGMPMLVPTMDSTFMQLHTQVPIRLIGFTDEEMATIKKKEGWIPWGQIAAGWYPELGAGQVAVQSPMLVLPEYFTDIMPQETVYLMTKAIVERWDEIVAVYPGLEPVDPLQTILDFLASVGSPMPLHAGVVQYMKEVGFRLPPYAIPPEYVEVG
jgi:TRAP transporter TAXI family solute receptor